jgi:hypothetical protein
MGNFNHQPTAGTRSKQWFAALLLVIPMVGHALGMLGFANSFIGKLPSNVILYLLPALGFFLLWRISANTATRVAAKIATITYSLWTIYFAVLELVGTDSMPSWILLIITIAQIITPLILAYTASHVGKNNRLSPLATTSVWVICVMCIVESYWSLANRGLSLWIFDGLAASGISVSAFREVYRWFVIILDVLAAFAFVSLCTSCAFNNHNNPNEPEPRYTAINRYMVTTVVITLALVAVS